MSCRPNSLDRSAARYTKKHGSFKVHSLRRHSMSDLHRRDFLAGTAGFAASAVLLGPRTAEAGDPSFMNNVPDPLLSAKELPTFKFALGKPKGRVSGKRT